MTLPNAKAKDILAFIHKIEAEAERRGVEKCIQKLKLCPLRNMVSYTQAAAMLEPLLNTPPND